MILTKRGIRQLVRNILREGVREDAYTNYLVENIVESELDTTSDDALIRAATDKSVDVRMSVARVPRALPLDALNRLVDDWEPEVRQIMASREDVPLRSLRRFLQDNDANVRAAALQRVKFSHNLPLEFLEKLLRSNDSEIKAAARAAIERMNLPSHVTDRLPESRRLAHRILREIKRAARN